MMMMSGTNATRTPLLPQQWSAFSLLLLLHILLACSATASINHVHLIGSFAPLFSGRSLSDCHNGTDTSCRGGVAAVAALQRHFASDAPRLTMHRLDKSSPFAQMHPLGWSVNRLILSEYYGYTFFSSPPSLLLQHKDDFIVSQRDISDLQSQEWPMILTNADIPPSVSWYGYVERVHYDPHTNLAVMVLAGDGEPMSSVDQVAAARTALKDVARRNEQRGCSTTTTSLYTKYLQQYPVAKASTRTRTTVVDMAWGDDTTILLTEEESTNNTTTASNNNNNCWIPVLYFSDFEPHAFLELIETMTSLEHPPLVIIDGGGNDVNGTFTEPVQMETPNTPRPNSTLWVTSMRYGSSGYFQHTLTVSDDGQQLTDVSNLLLDLSANLTDDMKKDDQYGQDIEFIRTLADQAEANDPVVGVSTEMPVARDGDYRRCKGGECEQGNLFADSLRWRANADVAFVTSGGLRGAGWPAGNVTISDIWATLPFPNTMCTGIMTGVSLFKLVDYSMGISTFQSAETQEGGRLLQVSGMKIVYNTQLQEHRVISIDIWDNTTQAYEPIERLKYYKVATDSFLCGAYDPYPTLLVDGLMIEGEVPGHIGDDLHQNIVGEYLTELGNVYDASRQGRLVNNTEVTEILNLVQTPEGCPTQTYWVETKLSCVNCPNSSHVQFSDEQLVFHAESGVAQWYPGRILLVNRELESFQVVPKNIPDWLTFVFPNNSTTTTTLEEGSGHLRLHVNGTPTLLRPGDSLALDFAVSAEHLEAGTALGTVSFGILDGGDFPGCVDNGDTTFDVLLRVNPQPKYNQLGKMRIVGFSLMGVALIMAASFGAWTHFFKRVRVVQKMQPLFLVMICVGVGVISLAMGSLSFDDEIVSVQWCNFTCMSLPWFVSMGWTITFAAIYSKLWRINKLFRNSHFRRITVSERDALTVFSVLFGLNFVILLLWTLLDPLAWERKTVAGEAWNTYGVCSSGTTGDALMGLAIGVNILALFLAALEAYKARNISGEFSEAKSFGVAIYTWMQVIAVAMPVLFLIDAENVTARYFLQVGLLFCLSITMLLNIFIPMVLHMRKLRKNGTAADHRGNIKVSGLHGPGGAVPTTTKASSLFTNSTVPRSSNPHNGSYDSFSQFNASYMGSLDAAKLSQVQHQVMNNSHNSDMNNSGNDVLATTRPHDPLPTVHHRQQQCVDNDVKKATTTSNDQQQPLDTHDETMDGSGVSITLP